MDGIVRGTAEQEEEEATLIWCVEGASDEGVNLWRQEVEEEEAALYGRITTEISMIFFTSLIHLG